MGHLITPWSNTAEKINGKLPEIKDDESEKIEEKHLTKKLHPAQYDYVLLASRKYTITRVSSSI